MFESRVFRPAWLAALLLFASGAVAQTPTTPIAARTDERAAAPAVAQKQRPNVVFVLVDDLGYGELGCYGNTHASTPNIDRLAAEGIRFERFYVNSPICSPSRVALMTGQYPARWRITSYMEGRAKNAERGMANWLPADAPSLARIMHGAGYRTGHFGKWHMGGGRDIGDAPLITEYGFDASLTQFEGMGDRIFPTFDTLYPKQPHRALPLGLASEKLGRGKTEFVKRSEVTGRYVGAALEFIRAARDAKQPFYVNLWTCDPHTPHEPSPANRGDGSVMAMYHGVIKELDHDLGVLFDAIRDDERLRDNTVIIFASDNGHDPVVTASAGLRGHKSNLYEGGIRDPFIVWAPARHAKGSKAGTVNKTTTLAGMDLPPSVLGLAGIPVPNNVKFDGQDMSRAYTGEPVARDAAICWVRPPDRPGPQGSFPDLAIRKGNLKLLIEQDGSNPQLFDVIADPKEQQDLAASQPRRVTELKTELMAWYRKMPQSEVTAKASTN